LPLYFNHMDYFEVKIIFGLENFSKLTKATR
jgi:hypothetical protein